MYGGRSQERPSLHKKIWTQIFSIPTLSLEWAKISFIVSKATQTAGFFYDKDIGDQLLNISGDLEGLIAPILSEVEVISLTLIPTK